MRRIKGRLVFHDKILNESGEKVDRPIRGAFLHLWDLDVIRNDSLAQGQTDDDGYFDIEYDPADAADRWIGDKPDLVLRMMDREYAYDAQGQVVSRWHVVKSFDAGKDIVAELFDFGTLRVAFWEYEHSERIGAAHFTPRVAVYDNRTPQDQRHGRQLEQLTVAAKYLPAHAKNEVIAKFREHHPTNKEIEADYEENATRKLGLAARSDGFICDMVLNGFNPQVLKKGPDDSYFVEFRWDGLQQDTKHFAPNTTAHFRKTEEGLVLDRIDVQKRIGGENSAHAQYRRPKSYYPGDAAWERAKRLFRCNYFLFGEVATHLAETHLNVEQYIVPIRRNILHSPIAQLLLPHFYGTTAVNLAANHILIADDGIVQKCSALTPESVKAAAAKSFGQMNWKGWSPRSALTDEHHFAKVGELYWEVLDSYTRDFFALNDDGIRRNWGEIKRMSDELLGHALPFIATDDNAFYDASEINTAGKDHPRIDGIPVAVSPVTGSEVADSEGLANLRQLCKYLLYHSTFKHAWVNDLQYLMGGEIEFATLGVVDDITNTEIDESRVVPPDEAIQHPFITYILNYTEYGYVIRNEDDDMNPALIKAVLDRRNDFAALGYDVRGLRSCINT